MVLIYTDMSSQQQKICNGISIEVFSYYWTIETVKRLARLRNPGKWNDVRGSKKVQLDWRLMIYYVRRCTRNKISL